MSFMRLTEEQAARLTQVVRRRLVDDLVANPEVFVPELLGDLNRQMEILDFLNLSTADQLEVMTELDFNPMIIGYKPVCSECGSDDIVADAYVAFDHDTGDWVLSQKFDSYTCHGACQNDCTIQWVVIPPKKDDDDG